jgi:hypothetical protein
VFICSPVKSNVDGAIEVVDVVATYRIHEGDIESLCRLLVNETARKRADV